MRNNKVAMQMTDAEKTTAFDRTEGQPAKLAGSVYLPAVFVIAFFVGVLLLWSMLDHTIPVWDSAAHLLRGYQCVDIAQAHMGFRHKIKTLSQISSFYTPLTYYLHAVLISALGPASWVDVIPRLSWYATACVSLYLLARKCFDDKMVATYAVAVWCLYPGAYGVSRAFALLDIPMTAMVFLSLWAGLVWNQQRTWRNAALLGLVLGLTFLTKQTAVLFLIAPMAFLFLREARHKNLQTCLMLVLSGAIGGLFFAAWAIPNYKAFKEFVGQNQSVMADQPIMTLFFGNLTNYITAGATVISLVGTILFIAALIFAKNKSKTWFVATGILSALFFHSILNWIPQFRYMLPATGLTAMITASLLVQLWRSQQPTKRLLVGALAAYGAFIFVSLSFTPWPLPIISALEVPTGLSLVRQYYGTDQISEPFWPRPKSDWGHDWLISSMQQQVGDAQIPLHLFSDTKELNAGGLAYVAKLHKSKIMPITFRQWSMAGYDFAYTKEQLDWCKWFAVLQNSTQAAGREFRTKDAQSNYDKLIALVTNDPTYEKVGTKALPDGSSLLLVRRRDWR